MLVLHQFMSDHRDEILEACYRELGDQGAEGGADYVDGFFDEMTRAVKRDSGVRESTSPLPQTSEAAARFGADRQRAGVPVTRLPGLFAAVSQAVGKTGEKYELTISAEEYKIMNRCLDAGIATAIENYWRRDEDRKNQRITESFGFLMHELRNALGNTNMAFKLLRTGDFDVNGHTANVLARNLARMEALVAQSLGTVQLEVDALPELVPVHVASVLRSLEAAAIADREITIQLELDEQLFIAGDELLLGSAISNLLHNALKFSKPGSSVRLGARISDDRVQIDVEDHCGGLQQEDPAELFEPYVKKREGSQKGTGLGLAITKRAVEAMNGDLNVADRPGEGCVFIARFPMLRR